MKQKFRDLLDYISGSRGAKVIVLVIVGSILFLFFYQKPSPQGGLRRPPVTAAGGAGSTFSGGTSEKDIIDTFSTELEELRRSRETSEKRMEKQAKQLEQFQNRSTLIFQQILDRVSETEARVDEAMNRPFPEQQSDYLPAVSVEDELPAIDPAKSELKAWGNLEEPEPAPPPTPAPARRAVVTQGDSVRVKLMAGVNAPVRGVPYPVLFKLIGNIAGPDGTKLPVGNARLIAAAQGNLTDNRAIFRLVSLNITMPSGERRSKQVSGWIVGEDGIRGMAGIPIDPLGSAIAGFTLVGAINGYGQSLQQNNLNNFFNPNTGVVSQSLTGDTGEFALGAGLSSGAREWQSLLTERLRDLIPTIQVYSGREATAVFNTNFEIDGLYDQLGGDEYSEDSWD